jgi:oligopeptide transport system permease protein
MTVPMEDAALETLIDKAPMGRSPARLALRRFLHHRLAVLGLLSLIAIALICTLGPSLLPFNAADPDFDHIGEAPNADAGHYFGTDNLGRDLLARCLAGGRISLIIGFAAMLISVLIGVIYGAVAGYCGGRIDNIMMRFVDILYALPYIFLVAILTQILGGDLSVLILALVIVGWLTIAVIVRAQTLSLKHKEYIEAARAAGVSGPRLVMRHIIPNTLGPIIVYGSLVVPDAILTESFLSFLGLGIQEPQTSLGSMIGIGAQYIDTAPWLLLYPGALLSVILLCLSFVADGLRDAFDPKDLGKTKRKRWWK